MRTRPSGLSVCLAVLAALACGAVMAQEDDDDAGLAALPATRDRPLFSPTRRAPPVARLAAPLGAMQFAPAPALPPPKPNLQLSGVIIGAGQEVAIVKRSGDARTMTVKVGAIVDGWTVSVIAAREITLRRDTETAVVSLPEPGR